MTQKQIPVRFTGAEELELYEFLRKESFETGLPMTEIMRRGLALYRKQKEEKAMTFKEMVEKARDEINGNDYVRLMGKARHMASDGTFTDNKEEWDENSQWLVADMDQVVDAYFVDYAIQEVFGIDPAEGDGGPEEWCERHGIEILG